MKNYLKLMRIKHYLKNILVFLPIFFSSNILKSDLLIKVSLGFVCFCLTSSIIYIINDINDIENDKKHPVKKNRPLASGKISVKAARLFMVILAIIIVLINILFFKDNYAWICLAIYFVINVLYSVWLKNKPIIDIFIISIGFLIRVLYGGFLIDVEVSSWLFLTILSGALFMASGKRRNELKKNKSESRKVLQYYNVDFLDKNMSMFLTMTLIFFSLWTVDNTSKYLVYTVPVLILTCLRYTYDVDNSDSFGDPVDVIFADKFLIGLGFVLAILMVVFIYVVPGVI